MPLKIEPMREEDYLQMGKEVKEGFDDGNVFMPASLNSPSIFGSVEYAPGEDRPVGIDHKRGYIHLCKSSTSRLPRRKPPCCRRLSIRTRPLLRRSSDSVHVTMWSSTTTSLWMM